MKSKMLKMIRTMRFRAPNIEACCYSTAAKDVKPASRMPAELTEKTDAVSRAEFAKSVTNEDLKWRTPWHETEGQYYSTLRTFYTEHNQVNLLKFLQSPIDLSPATIKAWWARRKETRDAALQQYIPQRNQTLGNELAAAHFIVYRGGCAKFFGENSWIKRNEFGDYKLPTRFQPDMYLQAIDCTDVDLFYEGLANFRDLHQLEWLCVSGCERMDDWCLDRISGMFCRSLLYLDLRDCPLITFRGLGALAKMSKLKILYVDDMFFSSEYEMTCLMLQEGNPSLDIRTE